MWQGLVGLVLLLATVGNDIAMTADARHRSLSSGFVRDGRLAYGKRLPAVGPNFISYSPLWSLVGRTHVHGAVRDVLLESWSQMHRLRPEVRFVFAETGWRSGGNFWPHRTHQNGKSVDLHVPVRDARGQSVSMPTHVWNSWGYDIEFDRWGVARDEGLRIDFDALAEWLLAIHEAARRHGMRIRRVIFAPELRPQLFAAGAAGRRVARIVPFKPGKAWVRHDEHVHIDFAALPRVVRRVRPRGVLR